jgi:lactate dehydrogenase-like 2-hydroxyacid dehydrogenase
MKKILITRRLLKESEDKASKMFDAHLNSNDELYSQSRLIELSQGCDAVLTSLTDKMDADTIKNYLKLLKLFQILQLDLETLILRLQKKEE